MVELTALHIHYRTLKGDHRVKRIRPSNPENQLRIREDIAKALTKIKEPSEYYYVVGEIEKADGSPAYRTMTKKIFFQR